MMNSMKMNRFYRKEKQKEPHLDRCIRTGFWHPSFGNLRLDTRCLTTVDRIKAPEPGKECILSGISLRQCSIWQAKETGGGSD